MDKDYVRNTDENISRRSTMNNDDVKISDMVDNKSDDDESYYIYEDEEPNVWIDELEKTVKLMRYMDDEELDEVLGVLNDEK